MGRVKCADIPRPCDLPQLRRRNRHFVVWCKWCLQAYIQIRVSSFGDSWWSWEPVCELKKEEKEEK